MFYKLSTNKTQTRDRGVEQKLVINDVKYKIIISWLQLHMETKHNFLEMTGHEDMRSVKIVLVKGHEILAA